MKVPRGVVADEPDSDSQGLYREVQARGRDEAPDIDRAILHQEEGIDLIPGNISLAALEISLVNVMSREMILKEFIDSVRDRYWMLRKEGKSVHEATKELTGKGVGTPQGTYFNQYST